MIPASETVSCFPDVKSAAMIRKGDVIDTFSCGEMRKMTVLETSHCMCSSWITLHTREGFTRFCFNAKVMVMRDGKIIEKKVDEVTVGMRLLRLQEGTLVSTKVVAVSREFMAPESAVGLKARLRRMFVGGVLCKA